MELLSKDLIGVADDSIKGSDPSYGEGKSSDDSKSSTLGSEELSHESDETMSNEEEEDNDDTHSFNSESDYEYEEYIKRWNESEGFDCAPVPDGMTLVTRRQLVLGIPDDEHCICVKHYTEMAIEQYNTDNNAKLKLVGIEKANGLACAGFVYYITFLAEDTVSGEVKSYQTEAHHLIWEPERKLAFVRLTPGQKRSKFDMLASADSSSKLMEVNEEIEKLGEGCGTENTDDCENGRENQRRRILES